MAPLSLVLATRNPGKVAEMAALLGSLPVVLETAAALDAPPVEEDAPTLEGNARKKAEALYAHAGRAALADDTGLEVEALDGRPGVHSARFAGEQATDAENRAHLVEKLDGEANRAAQFRTVLAFVENGEVHLFEGVCKGTLLEKERGAGGFGYDALFVPEGHDRTFAEMDKATKNAISHRGKALQAFITFLSARLS